MSIIGRIKEYRIKIIAAICRLLPIRKRKIVFWSDLGRRYSCNPRYLSEYLMEQHPGKYDIVWMFQCGVSVPHHFPPQIRIVRFFSLQWLYEIATARAVVCNHRIPEYFFFKRRRRQKYVQTWHSSLRLKMIEKDASATLSENYIRSAKADSREISHLISGCSFSSQIFRKAFWYKGAILECGTPRVDYLLNGLARRKELCGYAQLQPELRYILYAPTFRKTLDVKAYDVDMERLASVLKQKFGGEWKVLYRLHPNLSEVIGTQELPDCCIDMSSYHDIQELLILSDVLLTDYSSCMFDAAYMGKTCFLYANDLDDYVASDRGLYFDIAHLPFLVARSNAELEEHVLHFSQEEYQSQLQHFMRETGSFETGTACKTIAETLLS